MWGALTHFGPQHIPEAEPHEERGKKGRRQMSLSPKGWDLVMKCSPLPRLPFRASPFEAAKHRDFSFMSVSHEVSPTMVGAPGLLFGCLVTCLIGAGGFFWNLTVMIELPWQHDWLRNHLEDTPLGV